MRERRHSIRYAIYTRPSSDTVADFSSCDAQFTVCSDFAKESGEPGLTWCGQRSDDQGYSGATLERPGQSDHLPQAARSQLEYEARGFPADKPGLAGLRLALRAEGRFLPASISMLPGPTRGRFSESGLDRNLAGPESGARSAAVERGRRFGVLSY